MIQKTPVMRDKYDASAKFFQNVFQPDDRFEVQMVGRLVQHQDVRRTDQPVCQRDPFVKTARQGADARVFFQRQTFQQGFDTIVEVPCVGAVQTHLQFIEAFEQLAVVFVTEFCGQLFILVQPCLYIVQT